MTWAHPLLLVGVPVLALAAWWIARTDGTGRVAATLPQVRRRWADRDGLHARPGALRAGTRGLLLALAGALTLAALARPQGAAVAIPEVTRARDVMLALDLSRSMLAGDVAPSRLARARLLLEAFLDALPGERVGLTVFAGTAFVQSPLSSDHEVLRALLDELTPDYLPQGGTDYAAMLRAAREAFAAGGDGERFLVVLSDGEAHDARWTDELEALHALGVRVIALGVGTPDGAPVPGASDGGAPVHSRLEPATLEQLAAATGGVYRDAATWVDIAALVDATVARAPGAPVREARAPRRAELFQWCLAPALFLFLLSYWRELPLRPLSRALPARRHVPHRAAVPAAATALLLLHAWFPSSQAIAAATGVPPPRSVAAASPTDLAATVAELSALPALAAADHARLAEATAAFAARPDAPRGAARDGIIDDALAAVDRGASQDPAAADWPALRARLEALRTPPEPPPSPEQQQEQQQEQQESGGASDAQDQNSAAGQGGESSPQTPPDGGDRSASSGQGDGEPHTDQNDGAQSADAAGAERDGEAQDQSPSDRGESSAPDEAQADAGQASGDREAPEPRDASNDEGGGEPQPLDAPALADGAQPDAPPPHEAPSEAEQRLVGGGAIDADVLPPDPTAADTQARLAQVMRGDTPATLFERMNRAEGRPAPPRGGKDW